MTTFTIRSSAVNLGLPFRAQLPIPDGTVGQGDRQQFEYGYAGILWGAASVVTDSVHTVLGSWEVPARTGSWEVPARTGSWEVPE
jgi:hypothetical protein